MVKQTFCYCNINKYFIMFIIYIFQYCIDMGTGIQKYVKMSSCTVLCSELEAVFSCASSRRRISVYH